MNHPQEKSTVESNALQNCILKTLRFFDQFQYPLTPEELLDYLYKNPKLLHIKELKGVLDELEALERIEQLKGYVFLKGSAENIDKRRSRGFISERLWHRAKFYTQYLSRIPFVRMVAVCNTLAYNNAGEQSDIDLFIVIEKNHMWLSRLIITLTLQFFGVRRYKNKIAGRFCLSFFVTPGKLQMHEIALKGEDPYLAYWVKFLSPLYGQAMYNKFKRINQAFLNEYGLKFSEESTKHLYETKEPKMKHFLEKIFAGVLGRIVEWVLKKTYKYKTLQRMAKLKNQEGIIVSDEMLKFHNEDRREEYREKMNA